MKHSKRGPFFFLLGVTVSGFLFSWHLTRNRSEVQVVPSRISPSLVPEPVKSSRPAVNSVNCDCTSEKTGKTYSFCYKDPQNANSIGRKFDCEHLKILENLELVDNQGPFSNLSNSSKNEQEVIFCSAISDNHFNEGSDSLKAFRKFYPTRKFILYGLNLNKLYAQHLQKDKYIEYHNFDTTGYPKYTNNWMEYRFKPLILAQVLRNHSNVWWMDAHITVKKPNMTNVLFKEIEEAQVNVTLPLPSPIVFFINASHSNFAVLFPELLNYFPTNSVDLLKSTQFGTQLGANTFFVAKTQFTMEIFKWWVLCALDKTCMSPPGAQVYCRFGPNRYDSFANCFRFDQSVLNLLLLNEYQDSQKFCSIHGGLF